MKKKIQCIMAAAFMAILILPSIVWGVLQLVGLFNPTVMETLDYDLGENREKAAFPESFSLNAYTGQLEAYYNDRVPFRSVLIRWNQRFSGKLENFYQNGIEPALIAWLHDSHRPANEPDSDWPGDFPQNIITPEPIPEDSSSSSPSAEPSAIPPTEETHNYLVAEESQPTCTEEGSITYRCEDCGDIYTEILPAAGHDAEATTVEPTYLNYGYTSYTCVVCGKTWRGDFVEKPIDDSYFPYKQAGDYTILGRYDWLFYRGDATLSYYRGTNVLTEQQMADYLAILQQLQDVCDNKGIQLCFLISPNKEEVYSEYMPTYQIDTTPKREERFAAYVAEHSDIDFLYPLEELKAAKICYDTYYQYDTHWNNAGGFVGAQALYQALEMPVTEFEDWSIVQTEGAPIGLIGTGGLDPANYSPDHDYAIEYRPEVQILKSEGEQSIFCSTGIYRSWSDCSNEQKLVLLGDSFRIAMLPYLEKDFAEICVAHRDEMANVRQDIIEADVLVVTAVERFDKTIFEVAKKLAGYLAD